MKCDRCGKENISRNDIEAHGQLHIVCNECFVEFEKFIRKKKMCPKCGKTKLNTEFYPYESGGHHWTYWCKECVEEYIKNVSVGAN